MGNKQKKKILWQQYIAMFFFMLMGAVCGFLMIRYIDQGFESEKPFYVTILSLIGLFLGMYAAILVQLILHEAGHLVFGLLSGYRFSSFRIFSLMWIRDGEKIRRKRLSVAGTGGQCLMTPPDRTDGKIPVVLYNLGGSLMNLIVAAVFWGLYFICASIPFLSTFLLLFAVIGVILALMNGIPMRMGTVDNDGYNAFSMTRNREAMQAFLWQMKVNEQVTGNVRLKDMPKDWFVLPSDEAMKNSMVATVGVFVCSRLMDAQQFTDADKLIAHLLEIDSGIVGLHRSMMICDRIYVELITENRCEALDEMLTKEQQQFMKAMKNFPSVLRTEYAYALLCEKDSEKADRLQTRFEKIAKTYPHQADIQSERELILIASQKASKLQARPHPENDA